MNDDVTLQTPVNELSGVGKRYTDRLEHLGIRTVRDLLLHLPRRYEDFSDTRTIGDVRVGEEVTVQGEVRSISSRKAKRNRRLTIIEALIADDTGSIRAVWFNQPYLTQSIPEGTTVSLAGEVSVDHDGPVMTNPQYEKLTNKAKAAKETKEAKDDLQLRHTGRLVPVYPETQGLTSRFLRFLIEGVIHTVSAFDDPLPDEVLRRHDLPVLADAIRTAHQPTNEVEADDAKRRLAFEELLTLQLFILHERRARETKPAVAVPFAEDRTKQFTETLPFTLTDAQRKAAWEIIGDMKDPEPMARLLEGDVGSGKTVVAVIAALQAVTAGHQTAFMAPTAILATQHYNEIRNLLSDDDVRIALATSDTVLVDDETVSRRTVLDAVADGAVDIIVGTHALIQKDVVFDDLALVVVDEQHRFGVEQRAELVQKTTDDHTPHLLSMTATPIPRTLALTVYGDLDLSILDEMPKGRKAIDTRVVARGERDQAYGFIRSQLDEGRQAFIIFPLIEESEALESKALEEEYETLAEGPFADYAIGKLHGQMPASEKETIMERFAAGDLDILLSTSVVEVGIDVPNATVMMIEGAERFGLAQLHQFRGRVGRGEHQSYCFLLTESAGKTTKQRLNAILEADSGFDLAEKDLAIRGPGQFLGTQQSGLPDLAMASLKDRALIKEARDEAKRLMDTDPTLERWPKLREQVEQFAERVHPE